MLSNTETESLTVEPITAKLQLEKYNPTEILHLFKSDSLTIEECQVLLSTLLDEQGTQLEPHVLMQIAAISPELTSLVFTLQKSLDILNSDTRNVGYHLMKLCEDQTAAVYNLVWERNKIPSRMELFNSIFQNPIRELILSTLLSFYDNLPPEIASTLHGNYQGLHMYDVFAREVDLIDGEHAVRNFSLICNSQIRAERLLSTVLLNINRNAFRAITVSMLEQVVEKHPSLLPMLISKLYENITVPRLANDIKIVITRQLLSLKQQAHENNPQAMLAYAQILFGDIKNTDEAVSLCFEVIEDNEDNKTIYNEAYSLLFVFAKAFIRGELYGLSVTKNLHMAFILYQYIANKCQTYSIRNDANREVTDPHFLLTLGQYFEGENDFNQAALAYAIATLPERPNSIKELPDYTRDNFIKHVKNLFSYAVIHRQNYFLKSNLINGIIHSPAALLSLTKELAKQQKHLICFKLLVELKKTLPVDMQNTFCELSYHLSQSLIESRHYHEAYILLSGIHSKSPYFKKAASYLAFSGTQWQNDNDLLYSLTETEELEIRMHLIEEVYAAFEMVNNNQDYHYYIQWYVSSFSESLPAFQAALKEITLIHKNLLIELNATHSGAISKNTWHQSTRVITHALKDELQQKVKIATDPKEQLQQRVSLSDHRVPMTTFSKRELLLKRTLKFGLLTQPAAKQRTTWQKSEQDEWVKQEPTQSKP